MNDNKDAFLAVYEASRLAGVSSGWIRILLAERRLEGAQKVDGQWRIPVEALEAMRQRREGVSA